MDDVNKTQHYTKQAQVIIGNLMKYMSDLDDDTVIVEPFAGYKDLVLDEFKRFNWEFYDIDVKDDTTVRRDSLLNPPIYDNKYVVTNPPYLSKNKATDKILFQKYNYDDLYKISLFTMLNSLGGILVIPSNFFVDERSSHIRNKFLNNFTIKEINFYKEPVFDTTTYNICSFYFEKHSNGIPNIQNVLVNVYPENKQFNVSLYKDSDYRLGGDYFETLDKIKPIFSRLELNKSVRGFPTNISLETIDSRFKRFGLSFSREHYYGKNSDRVKATLSCEKKLSEEQELKLIELFNNEVNRVRDEYFNLIFTIFRDGDRKKVSYSFVYRLLTKLYYEEFGSDDS